jgi:hypothetical protein
MFPVSTKPLEFAVFAPARSLSGLLWAGGAGPVVVEAGGVTSMESPVD